MSHPISEDLVRLSMDGFIDEMKLGTPAAMRKAKEFRLRSVCSRFEQLDNWSGPKNISTLSRRQRSVVLQCAKRNGLRISGVGSGSLKARFLGSNPDISFEDHWNNVVIPAFDAAAQFDADYIRVFAAGYVPTGSTAEACRKDGLGYLERLLSYAAKRKRPIIVEPEQGLVFATLLQIAKALREIDNPWGGIFYDGANIATQGQDLSQIEDELGSAESLIRGVHFKDIHSTQPGLKKGVVLKEVDLRRFVPAGFGVGGYEILGRRLKSIIPNALAQLRELGIAEPHFYGTMEPHADLSEQFFGYTSPLHFLLMLILTEQYLESHGIMTDMYGIEDLMATWPTS
jgi:sugar phosphate isomerase/epimerase